MLAPERAVLTVVNVLVSWVPTVVTAAMNPYSMAVAQASSLMNAPSAPLHGEVLLGSRRMLVKTSSRVQHK
jgi:hypothetical protein